MGSSLPLVLLTFSLHILQASGSSLPGRGPPKRIPQINDETIKNAIFTSAEDDGYIQPTRTIDSRQISTTALDDGPLYTGRCTVTFDFEICSIDMLNDIRDGRRLPPVRWDDKLGAEAKAAAERCDNSTVTGNGIYGAVGHKWVYGDNDFRIRAWILTTMYGWMAEGLYPDKPNFPAIVHRDAKIAGCAWSEGCYPDYYLKCILSEAASGELTVTQIERRTSLFTGEYFPPKICDLRRKYGVDPVEREGQLELIAYESVRQCSMSRAGNEMRVTVGGGNWTEEVGSALAWEKWQAEINNPDFGQRFDVWVATRPQWKYVGCAWSGFCEDISGRILSCMFWDANNNGSLGFPDI